MAGLIYNILHDIPFTITDKNGNKQWMTSQGSREQLGAEGLVMAVSSFFYSNT